MKLSGTSWETFSDSENGAHAMAPLDAAVFVVPLGYGAGLPLPRLYLAKYLGSAEPQRAAWHVGMLGGVYTFALFLFAPGWGRISDQHARTQALMAGFAAFLVGSAIAAMAPHLGLVYRARIVVGAGAGAIMPAAQAFIANNGSPVDRSRRFVGLGSASLLRFVVGPAFETWLAGSGSIMGIGVGQMQNMFNWPSLLVAAVGIPILLLFPLSLGLQARHIPGAHCSAHHIRPMASFLIRINVACSDAVAASPTFTLQRDEMLCD